MSGMVPYSTGSSISSIGREQMMGLMLQRMQPKDEIDQAFGQVMVKAMATQVAEGITAAGARNAETTAKTVAVLQSIQGLDPSIIAAFVGTSIEMSKVLTELGKSVVQ